MGFQPGNKLAALSSRNGEKPFRTALSLELRGEKGHRRLRRLAQKLISCAENGESWAFNLLVDRLDGKLAQPVQGDNENPIQVHHIIKRIIVDDVEPPLLELKAEDIQEDG